MGPGAVRGQMRDGGKEGRAPGPGPRARTGRTSMTVGFIEVYTSFGFSRVPLSAPFRPT